MCGHVRLFLSENRSLADDEIALVVAFADERGFLDPGFDAVGLHPAQVVHLHVVRIVGSLFGGGQQSAGEIVALEAVGHALLLDACPRCAIALRPVALPVLAPTTFAADFLD